MKAGYLIGIDEVGRGPIAGPVTVCAFSIPISEAKSLHKLLVFSRKGALKDSKRMSRKERERCFKLIKEEMRKYKLIKIALSHVSAGVLDRIGIVPALKLGIRRCLNKLGAVPGNCRILLDGGLKAPVEYINQKTIVKGDQKVPVIALASVAAKVYRDNAMKRLSQKYPGYHFESHCGYGTAKHFNILNSNGLCRIHRKSFLRSRRALA